MSGLGWVLLLSAIPVTFVASIALVMERLASRRGPAAGSWVSALSLLVIVVLTPLAVCGLPQSWSLGMSSLNSRVEPMTDRVAGQVPILSSEPRKARESDEARSLLWSSLWWHRLREVTVTQMSSIRDRTRLMQGAWGAFVLLGSAGFLARLVFGVRGVRDCRRRSSAIDDRDVLTEVAVLRRALSIARQVEVRELTSLTGSSAAAAGWLRPFVLLPRDWRSWSHLERRAVLAHEMAHIGRADYVSGIIAQIGLVLHFYHPLVHWLVSRLRLQQELAADAVGAPLAGGRRAYLLALSRLALRPDENLLAWPARTFLPARGHLFRRIQMLQRNASGQDLSLSTVRRRVVATAILVGAAGIVALAFRGLAPANAAEELTEGGVKTDSNITRFDLSYLSNDAMGVYAIRPAAIFRIPGLKRQFEIIGAEIAKALPFGMPKLESIEQATVEFTVLPRDRSKKQPGRIMTGDWTVRTVNDFDWKPSIKLLVKEGKSPAELVEVRYENRVYYKAVGSAIIWPNACFYFPDAQTVVCSFHEDQLRRRIQQDACQRPEFLRGDDWQQVERGLVAIAINNRQGRLKLDLASDDPADLPIAPLLQQASRWVVGLDSTEVLRFRAIATCAGANKAEALAGIARERMAKGAGHLGRARSDGAAPRKTPRTWRSTRPPRCCSRLAGFSATARSLTLAPRQRSNLMHSRRFSRC